MHDSKALSGWILLGVGALAMGTWLSGCQRGHPTPQQGPEIGTEPATSSAVGPFNDRYHLTPGAGRSTAAPMVGSTSGPVLVDPLWHDRPATDRTLLLA